MLSSDLSTLLSERCQEIQVHGLSYLEFLTFHELEDNDDSLNKYINYGGLPGLRQIGIDNEEHVHDYLQGVLKIASEEIAKREFGTLSRINDNYPKYVISLSPLVTRSNYDGIIHLGFGGRWCPVPCRASGFRG